MSRGSSKSSLASSASLSQLFASAGKDGLLLEGGAAELAAATPEEVISDLKTNPEFAERIKSVALEYVETAVKSIEIPPIEGVKDWGSYAIRELRVKSLTTDRQKLSIDVSDSVYVSLSEIKLEFNDFDFEVDKKNFPKVQDQGTAEANAQFDAFVKFDIKSSMAGGGGIGVDDVAAEITIGELPVKVLSGSHKFLYNMLLSLFSSKVKEAVSQEIADKVDESIPLLQEKIAEATRSFSPELESSVVAAAAAAADADADADADAEDARRGNALSAKLIDDVVAARKVRLTLFNDTPHVWKLKSSAETPITGNWIVPPPDRLRPGELVSVTIFAPPNANFTTVEKVLSRRGRSLAPRPRARSLARRGASLTSRRPAASSTSWS
jgi:hypothetical protein